MKGKSKLISSKAGNWGPLAGKNGTLGNQGINVNTKHYKKSGQTAAAPSLSGNMNPMKDSKSMMRYSLKGV